MSVILWTQQMLISLFMSLQSIITSKLLLDNGANINAINHWKTTPLMYAYVYGHLEVIRFLLKHGANMNMINYWGQTAKDRALEYKHLDCVHLLESYELTVTKRADR